MRRQSAHKRGPGGCRVHSAHDRTCLGLHGQDFSSLSTRITHIAARHAAFSTRTMDQPWSAASRTQELIVRERPEPRGPATGGAAGGERHPHPRDGPVVSGAWFLRVETSRSLLLSCLFAVPLSLSSVLSTVRLKQEPVLNVQPDRFSGVMQSLGAGRRRGSHKARRLCTRRSSSAARASSSY